MNTIGIKDAAERYGISTQTLYRAVNAGKIAAYKPGRNILLDADSLDDWFKASKIIIKRPVGKPRKGARRVFA